MDLKTLQDMPPWEWPRGTGKMVLEVLKDPKAPAEDRRIAVDLAGDVTIVDDELAAALLAILGDDACSEELRAQAALSLGPALEHSDMMEFDPDDLTLTEAMFEKVQAKLHAMYGDPRVPAEVRRRVLEASVRAPQDWHAGAIRAAFGDPAEGQRVTAVYCMRHVRGFQAEILEALGDADPAIRCEAILAAGASELDAAWPVVEELLRTERKDKALLVAAIEASASLRPREAAELLQVFTDSEDEDIADAVADALETAELVALHREGGFGDDDEDDGLDGDGEDGEDDDDFDDEEDEQDEEGDEEDEGGKILN